MLLLLLPPLLQLMQLLVEWQQQHARSETPNQRQRANDHDELVGANLVLVDHVAG